MKKKTIISFLEKHKSDTKSKFVENAYFRRDNKNWLLYSKKIASILIEYIENNSITKEDFANELQVNIETFNRMLKGDYNFSIYELVKIEKLINKNLLIIQ